MESHFILSSHFFFIVLHQASDLLARDLLLVSAWWANGFLPNKSESPKEFMVVGEILNIQHKL